MGAYEENIIIEQMNRIYRNLKSNIIETKNLQWLLSLEIQDIIFKSGDFTVKKEGIRGKYYYKGIEISESKPISENVIIIIRKK